MTLFSKLSANPISPNESLELLISAIINANTERVKDCIKRGANINGNAKLHPLSKAIQTGNAEIVKLLLVNNVNVNKNFPSLCPPLLKAIKCNASSEIISLLLKYKTDVNASFEGETPLTMAIRMGKLPLMELLIEAGVETNTIEGLQKTPLSLAVACNNAKVVELLIKSGADPYFKNQDGTTAVELAKNLNLANILNLLQCKSNSRKEESLTNYTSLARAICGNNLNQVEHLLKEGIDVCKVEEDGKSPLLLAVETNNLEIVKLLLEYGAFLTIPTALLESIDSNRVEIFRYFLETKVHVNFVYRDGCTLLTRAIEKSNFPMVKRLVDKEADVNLVNGDGDSPLLVSLKFKRSLITKFLIDKGAILDENFIERNFNNLMLLPKLGLKLTSVLSKNNTVLVKAVQKGNLRMVRWLLEEGINVDQSDDSGKTVLQLAALNRSFGIVKCLIDKKANLVLAVKELRDFAEISEDFFYYFKTLHF